MVLQRWDPFRDFRRFERNINRLGFDSFDGAKEWAVPVDVVEEDDKIVIKATVPGINPDDINVTIEDRLLTIKGETTEEHEEKKENYLRRERRSGKFYRSLRLPDTVDTENADSKYENGVVNITLPKIEAKKPKKLEVKAA